MISYFAYFLLGVGVILFLTAWFDKSRKSMPFMFVATMMIVAGLAILQLLGTDTLVF